MVEHIVNCPACIEGELQILSDQMDIPHFGEIIISTMICSTCGYRSSDIIPLKSSSPMRYILKIDRPSKMDIRVVRSGSSTVIVPEIGARMDPGSSSEGYVTNVEGVLRRFLDILLQLRRDLTASSDDPQIKSERIEILIALLEAFIRSDIDNAEPITLIIEDPLGNSAIISENGDDLIKEPLADDEIAELLSSKKEKDIITEL